ncbi:OLC1v1034911C1 [Oldenlandia corymbosa var. corymbosa]|uniref:OLC1v1034911C1 n=1 Tax=Oldenlandia corymbosa var. corymbosa TaxID=529605 RepID=A0AAV1CRT9_OLDCO|nr:OLC1v1034911C1 [Oldenlandia corymbosa var. corymbosa]
MMGSAAKCFRVLRIRRGFPLLRPPPPPPAPPRGFRLFSESIKPERSSAASSVTQQMIDYAFSLSRSQKSDESFSQSMLVLEQCRSNQSDEDSKGMVLLAMATILYERGDFTGAIEKLQSIEDLGSSSSSLAIRVAAVEALVGMHLEMDQAMKSTKVDTSSVLTNTCYNLLDTIKPDIDGASGFDYLEARAKALKGLFELLMGSIETAESFLSVPQKGETCTGNVALSYGEYVHGMRKFPLAQELYQNVIQQLSAENSNNPHEFGACNMAKDEVLLAATCALGQLEAHLGNLGDSEEILTRALKRAEEHFGSNHPKVGVILTCIALMYRLKATAEGSSSLLVQEGLYRKAIELLKAPPLETEGAEVTVYRREIVALARGGYAEILCLQQNRKAEGERMRRWAEATWKNRRLSLAEALDISEDSTKVPIIETRICRCL